MRLNKSEPNMIIPRLLAMNESWNAVQVRKEIFPLLITYKSRNFGGHNIAQQTVIRKEYQRILQQLMSALFMAIEAL